MSKEFLNKRGLARCAKQIRKGVEKFVNREDLDIRECIAPSELFPSNVCFNVSEEFNGAVYAGTTEGLYKSSDGGKKFTRINSVPEINITALAVFQDKLYAGSHYVENGTQRGNLYVSSDGENVSVIKENSPVVCLCVHGNKLYVGQGWDSSLFVTSDGKNFASIGDKLPGSYVKFHSMTVFKGKLYVAAGWTASTSGVFVLSDNGRFITKYGAWAETLTVFRDKLYVGTQREGLAVTSDGEKFERKMRLTGQTRISTTATKDKLYIVRATIRGGGNTDWAEDHLYESSDGEDFLESDKVQPAMNIKLRSFYNRLLLRINAADYKLSLGGKAASTAYDNSSSGLTAENVQDAIDEVCTRSGIDKSYPDIPLEKLIAALVDDVMHSKCRSGSIGFRWTNHSLFCGTFSHDNLYYGVIRLTFQNAVDDKHEARIVIPYANPYSGAYTVTWM